jgi:hypothetical protein
LQSITDVLQFVSQHQGAIRYMLLAWVSIFVGLAIFLSYRFRTLKLGVKVTAFLVVVTLLFIMLR